MKYLPLAAFAAATIALGTPALAQSSGASSSTPTPTYEHFVSGDYIFAPTANNALAPNSSAEGPSYSGRAVGEFRLGSHYALMLEFNAEQFAFPHPAGVVTNLGSARPLFVPAFTARDEDYDARLGIGVNVLKTRVYVVGSYLQVNNNYGYPQLNGAGFGVEKLPDLNRSVSAFGDYLYYPQLQGGFTDLLLGQLQVQYRFAKYEVGVAYSPLPQAQLSPFVQAGWRGTYGWAGSNAPIDRHDEGPFFGVGLKF